MKSPLTLFLPLVLVSAALAQTAPAIPAAPPTSTALPSSSWLTSRGMLSVDDLSALTGAQFSPAERAKLETVVATRNAELQRLNAQLSAQLGQILKEGDSQIAARIETKAAKSAEQERMERLKRLQPSRYQEMMRRKRAEGKVEGTGGGK